MENARRVSWEDVDFSSVEDILNTAVIMYSPDEARAFYEACCNQYGQLFVNKGSWGDDDFYNFCHDGNNAMSIEKYDGDKVGMYWADKYFYKRHSFSVIDFSDLIKHGLGSNAEFEVDNSYDIDYLIGGGV